MKGSVIVKESELFYPVKLLLEDKFFCEVHGEVDNYDVVGIADGYEVVVELKTSMSLSLLDQMMDRVGVADYVFVAVPTKKSPMSRSAMAFLQSLEIGIIEVDLESYRIFKKNEASYREHIRNENYRSRLYGSRVVKFGKRFNPRRTLRDRVDTITKNSIGGVTSSEMNSPYKITITKIQAFLKRRTHIKEGGWATVDEILEAVQTHYHNPKPSVMATLQENWNSDWIETKKENGKRYFRFRKEKEV